MVDRSFLSLIGNEPRESPHQLAVRLLSGAGAAALGVGAGASVRPLGGVLHTEDPDMGIAIVGKDCDLVPARRGVPAVLAVDELAPLAHVKVHTAAVVASGYLRRRRDLSSAPHEPWEGAACYVLELETVEVRDTHGVTAFPAEELYGVTEDGIATRRLEVVEQILTRFGTRLVAVGQSALLRAGDAARVHGAQPTSVDAHGVTLLCSTDAGVRQVRAAFAAPARTVDDVLAALEQYDRIAA